MSRWTTWRASPGTARRCTRSSTAWSSGFCAIACSRPCRPLRLRQTQALTLRVRCCHLSRCREHLDSVLRNRRLNQLVHDVAMDVTVDDLARQSWDREEVHKVFDGLEFRVLRDRLFATLESVEVEADSGFDLQGSVLSSEQVPAWLSEHTPPGSRVGVHVDGTWARGTGDARAVAIATGTGVAAYIDLVSLDPAAEGATATWLGAA